MKNVFMILLVILGVCSFAHALQCYSCHSDKTKDCGDTTTNEVIKCQKDTDPCSKVFLDGKITKGCAGLQNKDAGCKKRGEGDDLIETCYCHTDFCNSAGTYKIYPILIASLILAPLLSSVFL